MEAHISHKQLSKRNIFRVALILGGVIAAILASLLMRDVQIFGDFSFGPYVTNTAKQLGQQISSVSIDFIETAVSTLIK